MQEVVSIAFRRPGKTYFFDPAGLKLKLGDMVVVKTTKGTEVGEVVEAAHPLAGGDNDRQLKKVIRRAGADDLAKLEQNKEKEAQAFKEAQEKIAERGLSMQLVEAEQAFDGSKITFFFTAENRVDFRELVKDLAGHFKTRIELRQIGVRDKARMIGGFGHCGQRLCCTVFLSDLNPVSIRMAKEQDLSLNPIKISGTCGRLMCCLRYEFEAYKDFKKRAPKKGSCVETCDGCKGSVIDQNVLRERLKIRDDEGHISEIRLDEVKSFSKPERDNRGKKDEGRGGRPKKNTAQSGKPVAR